MGLVEPVRQVKLICGIIAQSGMPADDVCGALESEFGRIDLKSDVFPFNYTDYYFEEMGVDLARRFVSFADPFDPGQLAEAKLKTNAIERRFARQESGIEKRRVNLDPGYMDAARLVLATTKDFSHRVYLGSGIYAEVTMRFRKDGCVFSEWTYPDFRSGQYTPFLLTVRNAARDLGLSREMRR